MTELPVIENKILETNKNDHPVVEIHDRILDAYFGKMGDQFMRDTHKRVHWVCSMAKGGCILDVGCSQGIVPVLLGREGYAVTGIDSDGQAIVAAETFLADQKHDVQTKVNFINADFISFPFDGALFDTVIISEVLEHLVDPASFVSLAAERLPPGGTLVVTVPFGVNDYIDHKWTFYALEPLRLLWELFSVNEVEVFGKWIGFSCSKRKSKARKGLTEWPWPLLEQMEEAFHSTERALLTQSQSLRTKLDDVNKKYRLSTEQVSLFKNRLVQQEADQKAAEGGHKKTQAELELLQGQLVRERTFFNQEISRLIEEGQSKSSMVHDAEKQLMRREGELATLRSQLNDTDLKYISVKEQLAHLEAIRKRAEEAQAQTLVQIEALQGRLDEERKGFQQEITHLTADSRVWRDAVHEVEKQLTRREGELEAMRGHVDVANQNYRTEIEQVATLNAQLAQQDANRKATEDSQAQTLSQIEEVRTCLDAERTKFKIKIDQLTEAVRQGGQQLYDTDIELKKNIQQLSIINNENNALKEKLNVERSQRAVAEQKRAGHYKKLEYLKARYENLARIKNDLEHENAKIKRSLSLAIGTAIVQIKSINDFLSLPWKIVSAIRRHNHKIRNSKQRTKTMGNSGEAQVTEILTYPSVRTEANTLSELPGLKPKSNTLKKLAGVEGWPTLNTCNNKKPIVLGVMDEFTTGCFNKDVNLVQPRPDNWEALAEKYSPSLIFVESAWKGNFGSWQYRVANYTNKPGNEIEAMTKFGQENNVPVVFWNKEDPVHHDKFMESAKVADLIFTTDANMIASYQSKTGNSKVYPLPFAAQPSLHKPSPLTGRLGKSCFAGSWYGGRHAERGAAMQWLLMAANPLGLDIYDRNHGTGAFPFPDEYRESIKGSLPYEALCTEYGRYKVFLNVNSVTNSPTMFSRRVFELLACGTPVVSTYAKGIEEMFGTDIVWFVDDAKEAKHAIQVLLSDEQEWRRRSLAGIRKVFAEHTYLHRLHYIYEKAGLKFSEKVEPVMLLLAKVGSTAEYESLLSFAKGQSWQGFELFIETAVERGGFGSLPVNVKILEKGVRKSVVLNDTLKSYDLVGWLNPLAEYGENYLQDIVNATRYAPDCNAWGKSVCGDQFTLNMPVHGDACILNVKCLSDNFLSTKINKILQGDDIYCLDSEEFKPAPSSFLNKLGREGKA